MTLGLHKLLFPQNEVHRSSKQASRKTRSILAVSTLSSECDTLRVLCLQQGWHLRVASNLQAAIELQKEEDIRVILYDQDAPGTEWQLAIKTLLARTPLTCLILLSRAANDAQRLTLLSLGGYDIVQKPLALASLSVLVNGCWTLLET